MKVSKADAMHGKRAIIYTRVSTDEQAERGFSLAAQEERLRQHCALNGIEVVRHFQDDASAKTFNRPAFTELLTFAQGHKKELDFLLVVKWDRFSRNMWESFPMIARFAQWGIEVQAVEQPIDTSIPENKILQAIYLATPDVENARRAQNTKDGMRRAMREGRWVNRPPIGYRNGRDANNRPLMVPDDRAGLVREAFEAMAKGIYTTAELLTLLRKKGLRCSKAQFYRLLQNPLYKGVIVIPAYRDEAEMSVQGLHVPLIEAELFDKVQRILADQSGNRRGVPKQKKREELPLRGHLNCSRCGRVLTGSQSRGKAGTYYAYYHCREGCRERHPAEQVNRETVAYLRSLSIAPEIADLYGAVLEDLYRENEGSRDAELATVEKSLRATNEKLLTIDERFIEGDLERDSYQRLKGKYSGELDALERRKEELTDMASHFEEYISYGLSLISDIGGYYERADLRTKQRMLGVLLPGNLIYENGKCRTPMMNPAIALLRGKINDSGAKNSETDALFRASVSFGTPNGIRTRATTLKEW